jgi:SsrA-binding protein
MAQKEKNKAGMLSNNATIAENRRARFDYFVQDKFEAGIMLTGTEVKSLRLGQCSLNEGHVAPNRAGEIFLYNVQISEYQQAGQHLQHDPKRARKLLLHGKEVQKLIGAVTKEGYTIVPLRLFFNARGKVKIEIALAKGKKLYDKRETEKKRDWGREKAKIMKQRD